MSGIEPESKKNSMKCSTSVDCFFRQAGGSRKSRQNPCGLPDIFSKKICLGAKQTKSNLPTILSLEWYGDGNHTSS
ncbi:MAG: hypothetical protein UU98_C0004G0049 [Parcubacteria group bacterium GW2011_GWD2_42_14]|nr:MAG: hypothetical protein UU98_C0004G0049 [Parcubacteria group bacterium GW2011_GWD2_42_14]